MKIKMLHKSSSMRYTQLCVREYLQIKLAAQLMLIFNGALITGNYMITMMVLAYCVNLSVV